MKTKKILHKLLCCILTICFITTGITPIVMADGVNLTDVSANSDDATKIDLNVKYNESIGNNGDVDWYKFTTRDIDEFYQINIYSYGGFNCVLYDSDFKSVWSETMTSGDKWSDKLNLNKNSTYYFKVYQYGGHQPNYYFTVYTVADNAPNISEKAINIALNEKVDGAIEGNGDVDWYKFTTRDIDEFYHVNIYSYGGFNYALYDKDFKVIWSDTMTSGDKWSSKLNLDSNAPYYIKIYQYGGHQPNYYLKVHTIVDNAPNSQDLACELINNIQYSGAIEGNSDIDWFEFSTGNLNVIYNLYLKGSSSLNYDIYDANMNVIASDWMSSGYNSNHRLNPNSKYYLKVTQHNGGLPTYVISIKEFTYPDGIYDAYYSNQHSKFNTFYGYKSNNSTDIISLSPMAVFNPDEILCLPKDSYIVFEMTEPLTAQDNINEIAVYAKGYSDDKADVYVSTDASNWVKIGTAKGGQTTYFDLTNTNLVKYIKLVGTTNYTNDTHMGIDLVSLEVFRGLEEIPEGDTSGNLQSATININPYSGAVGTNFDFNISFGAMPQKAFLQFDDPASGDWLSEETCENNVAFKINLLNPVSEKQYKHSLIINTPGNAENAYYRKVRVVYVDEFGARRYSAERKFAVSKASSAPVVSVNGAENATSSSVDLKGIVVSSEKPIKEIGFHLYTMNGGITNGASYSIVESSKKLYQDGTFSAKITGLDKNTKYYYYAYAIDENGVQGISSDSGEFTTAGDPIPYVVIDPIDEWHMTANDFSLKATIYDTKSKPTDVGFNIYGPDGSLCQQHTWTTTGDMIMKDVKYDNKTKEFSVDVKWYTPGQNYTAVAFAIFKDGSGNKYGLEYDSDAISFTMKTANNVLTAPTKNQWIMPEQTSVTFTSEITGTAFGKTDFRIMDKDYNDITVLSAEGEKPSVNWDCSSMERGVYNVRAITTLDDGRVSVSDIVPFHLYKVATSISITAGNAITLAPTATKDLNVSFTPKDATNKTVKWTSDNTAVAKVNKNGLVTGVGMGTATIKATAENGTLVDTCTVTVESEFQGGNSMELNMPTISSGISNGAVLSGPSLNFGGECFTLFDINLHTSALSLFDVVESEFDYERKVHTVKIGMPNQGVPNKGDGTWRESYWEIKEMVTAFTGNDDVKGLWTKYRNVWSKLPHDRTKFGFDFDKRTCGYMEFDTQGNLLEGGVIVALETELSLRKPFVVCPAAFLEFRFEAGAEGKFYAYVTPREGIGAELGGSLKIKAGPKVGLGVDVGVAEGHAGFAGYMPITIALDKNQPPFKVELEGEIYLEYEAFKFINGERSWSWGQPMQLWPRSGLSELPTFDAGELQLETRDYLKNNKISLMGVDDSTVKQNIYPRSESQLVDLGNGKRMLIWIDDDITRNIANSNALYYSIYENGSWSEAKQVDNDGTSDFSPNAIATSDGKVHLVWQNTSKTFDDDVTINDMYSAIELSYSVYENGSFSAPVNITANNEVCEMTPQITSDNSNLAVVWVEKTSGGILETGGTYALCRSQYKTSWSAKENVKVNLPVITSFKTQYNNGLNEIAYIIDSDNDYTTINDSNVYLIKGSRNNAVTQDSIYDSDVIFAGGSLYWLSDGNLMRKTGDEIVDENLEIGGMEEFTIVDNGSSKMILYTVADGFSNDIYAHKYVNGVWGEAVNLTKTTEKEDAISAYMNNDGNPVIAFNKTEVKKTTEDSYTPYGAVSLNVWQVTEDCNLSITSDLMLNILDVAPNKTIPVTFTMQNTALSEIEKVKVDVLDNNGKVITSKVINETLKAGASKEIVVDVALPSYVTDLHVKVSPVDMTDVDTSDNQVNTKIYYSDVKVSNRGYVDNGDSITLTLNVENQGYETAEDILISVYDGGIFDTLLTSTIIDGLDVGESEQVSVTALKSDMLEESENGLYIKAEIDDAEMLYNNNVVTQMLSNDSEVELSIAEVSKTASGITANVVNSGSSDAYAVAYVGVYDASGKLLNLISDDIEIYAGETLPLNIPVNIPAGSTAKLFVWKSGSIKPLCDAVLVK